MCLKGIAVSPKPIMLVLGSSPHVKYCLVIKLVRFVDDAPDASGAPDVPDGHVVNPILKVWILNFPDNFEF